MMKCPFCGRRLTDEQYEECQRLKRAEGGKAKTERKKAASAANMAKAREAITPERRAEILAKARLAKAARKAAQQDAEKTDEQ